MKKAMVLLFVFCISIGIVSGCGNDSNGTQKEKTNHANH